MSGEINPSRILIVDDEAFVREAMELYFATEGFEVVTASGGAEALELLDSKTVDLAILDILMPGMDGIQLLREMKKLYPDIEVVMASGCGTLETAIEAMRLGAYDYVTKPILNFEEDLLKVVRKALERRRLLMNNRELARDLKEINHELKTINTRLKKSIAELEVLYETGRILGDLESQDALLDLAEATLFHHLEIPRALIILEDPDGWRLHRAPGLPGLQTPSAVLTEHADFFDAVRASSEATRLTREAARTLGDLLAGLGVKDAGVTGAACVPLRAAGELLGCLVPVGDETDGEMSEEQLRLLALLGAQISAPLALYRVRVSP